MQPRQKYGPLFAVEGDQLSKRILQLNAVRDVEAECQTRVFLGASMPEYDMR